MIKPARRTKVTLGRRVSKTALLAGTEDRKSLIFICFCKNDNFLIHLSHIMARENNHTTKFTAI